MLSINMRIFKTVLFFVALCTDVRCAPIESSEEATTSIAPILPTTSSPDNDHYDQRQNGAENYRVHVDGLVLLIAPVEALLLGGMSGTSSAPSVSMPSDHGDLAPSKPISAKPRPPAEDITKPDMIFPKHAQRSGLRLANLIAPLLRRIRHE